MKKVILFFLLALSILFLGCEKRHEDSVTEASAQIAESTEDAVAKIKKESRSLAEDSKERLLDASESIKKATDTAAKEAIEDMRE